MNCLGIAVGEVEYCRHRLALMSTEAELALAVPSASVQYWIYARHEAIDRVVRYAQTGIDAGVVERQAANDEHLGAAIGDLLRNVLRDLVLPPEQQVAAPGIVRRRVTQRAGTALGSSNGR